MNPILHSFGYALDFLREQLADVAPSDMVAQPSGILNHPAWVVGHLTHTCQILGGTIGLPEWLAADWGERFGTGSIPLADPTRYEPKADALVRLGHAQTRLGDAVRRLDDARLDEPFPDPTYLDVFPTIRHALTQVLVGHTAYHIGQVSAWRRAMRLAPTARSFE